MRTPPPTCGFLIQLVLCKTMWFIGVEVDKRRVHPLLKKILDPPLLVETLENELKSFHSSHSTIS